MGGDVIKSFLVGLGFSVDDSSLSKFNQSITEATIKVTALSAATIAMAGAVVKGISSVSKDFEAIGYEYHIITPAINKALLLRRELLKSYSAAGINITKVVKDSLKLNISLDKTRFAFEAIYKSVASRFFSLITKQSDIFRNKLYANMPKIQAALERVINFIFHAFDAVVQLGTRLWSILERVYDFFVKLDKATGGWSTAIVAAVAAWKILNLAFLATPLGLLLAGLTSLLALWDDFKTFQEGGQSFINWGSDATKMIVGMTAAITALSAVIIAAGAAYALWTNATKIATAAQAALDVVLNANPIGLIVLAVTALIAGLTALDAKWNIFGGHVTGFFTGLGGKILGFAGGNLGNAATNIQNGVGSGAGVGATLGTGNQTNSQTNQHVNQQTTINVNGVPNASAAGVAVASEQRNVNFDLVENLRGSVKSGGNSQ